MNGERYHLRSSGERPPIAGSSRSAGFSHTPAGAQTRQTPQVARRVATPTTHTTNHRQPSAINGAGGGIGNMTFEQREELHEVFDTIDQAGRGYIPISRVSDVLQALGLVSPSAKDWEQWCARVDFDKTGRIGYETLEEFVSLRYDEMDQRTEMVAAFMLFKPGVTDVEKAKITIDDLRRIAAHTGEHIPDEELEEMVRIADIDGTEGVSFDDFMRIMRKTGLF